MSRLEHLEKEGDAKCVMAYSHDGFGLGHLRRNTTIASYLVTQVPKSSVLMLIGCPAGAVFKLPTGVDFIKLPSIIKQDTGVWRPLRLRIGLERTQALRVATIQQVAHVFHPQVLLVDHVPVGVWGELLPVLEMLKRSNDPPLIVLGLRDILDRPEVTRALWESEGAYKAIREYYDEIFIYGCREVFDTSSEYGLERDFAPRIRYCGYVCAEEHCKSKEQMRRELQVEHQLIVVTGGGGVDAYPMMVTCMKALNSLGPHADVEAIFITGPLMDHEQRERLRQHAKAQKVRVQVLTQVEDSLNYLNAADLVVTMAGYNTMCQVLQLRRRALVVPRSGPSAEQQMRARLFAERGLADVVFSEELLPKKMAAKLVKNLQRKEDPSYDPTINTNGGRNAAARLAELLARRTYYPVQNHIEPQNRLYR
jgi:predicted glycosyltransferase